MRTAVQLVLAVALASPLTLAAQRSNAPPASIYSIGGSTLGPPPASIYSAPTRSSAGFCCSGGVRFGFGRQQGRHFPGPWQVGQRRHRGRQFNGGALNAPLYVPYAVYPYSYDDYAVETDSGQVIQGGTFQTRRGDSEVISEEAPTIFENRPGYRAPAIGADSRYGAHYRDERQAQAREEPAQAEAPRTGVTPEVQEATHTVLVFRDGHRKEITNYAIMGTTLFVLSGEHAKIPVSELNLDATIAENDTRGIDFRVPKNQ